MPQLHLPAEAARSDPGLRRKLFEPRAIRYKCIARIFTFGNSSEIDSVRGLKRNILQAVNGGMGPPIERSLIDFVREKSFAADLGHRHIEDFIACGFDASTTDSQPWPSLLHLRLGPVRLPQCERASSCTKLEARHS